MANANMGLKHAARIGWEQKLMRLCGADKFEIVKIPADGIRDLHNVTKIWMPDHFKEVLVSNGFECVDVVEGTKVYQKGGKHGQKHSTKSDYGRTVAGPLAGRKAGKGNSRPQGSGQGTQRPAPDIVQCHQAQPVQA